MRKLAPLLALLAVVSACKHDPDTTPPRTVTVYVPVPTPLPKIEIPPKPVTEIERVKSDSTSEILTDDQKLERSNLIINASNATIKQLTDYADNLLTLINSLYSNTDKSE